MKHLSESKFCDVKERKTFCFCQEESIKLKNALKNAPFRY